MNEIDYSRDVIPVKIVLTHPDAKVPEYFKKGDAGADVRFISHKEWDVTILRQLIGEKLMLNEKNVPVIPSPKDCIIAPRYTAVLDLGFRIELEPGWEMQVRSRSGLAKLGLVVANAPGTIDSGYRGPCMVLLHNNSDKYRVLKPGIRIAQFVLKRAPQALYKVVDELSDSDRGVGGFGSTGVK